MKWKLISDRPIYTQIAEEIQRRILSGVYPLGSSMPSVRVLAQEASVNPNTVQKAMAELENQKLLHTQRTSGRVITTDERLIMRLKERIASEHIERYFDGMRSLGIGRNAAATMLSERANTPLHASTMGKNEALEAASASTDTVGEAVVNEEVD